VTIQLALIQDTTIKKTIISVPIEQLSLSEYNPRSTRPDDDIDKLARRISGNGYEITRALWVYQNGDGYKVFAGGTRLEAARRAACKTVPAVLHDGLTEDDIVKLADEDNENDEYHRPTPTTDVWASYAKLEDEGWKQERIGKAKRVSQGVVSQRLRYHKLPDEIKNFIAQEKLKEKHLREIIKLLPGNNLSLYLPVSQAHLELCQLATKLTVDQTKELVTKWQGFIELAEAKYQYLKDQQERYEAANDIEFEQKWYISFVEQLAQDEARTKAAVTKAYTIQRDNYLAAIQEHAMELARQRDRAEAEQLRLEQEKAKTAAIEAILANIHHGDFYEVCKQFADDSIDVIITDPPYPKEYISEYGRLAEVAVRVLKPGGFLLAMAGHSYLPEILQLMLPHLNYHWTISYQMPGGQSPHLWTKNINTFWKPVLWFTKGDFNDKEWYGDVVSSDVNDNDKSHHKWGQSESGMARLVEKYTKPGVVILDPFFGGGTTGLVALQLERQFIGIDKDSIEDSRERIFNYLTGKDNDG
jgi:ParB/RepB/Spo0J family partition protein